MAKKQQPVPIDVSIEREGKLHIGTYTVVKGVITVRSLGASKVTQIGKSPVMRIAQLMLLQLVAENRRETAAINDLVLGRPARSVANDRSSSRISKTTAARVPVNAGEVSTRLDHLELLAGELANCHRNVLQQIDLTMQLHREILAARLALAPVFVVPPATTARGRRHRATASRPR